MTIHDTTLADTLGVGHSTTPRAFYGPLVSEALGVTVALGGVRAHLPILADTATFAVAVSALRGLQLFEVIALAQSQTVNSVFHSDAADLVRLQDRLLRAYPQDLADDIELAAAITSQRAIEVLEDLHLAELLLPAFRYTQDVAEGIRLAAAIARFFGATAADTFDFVDLADGPAFMVDTVSETIDIAEAMEPRFVLRAIAADTIDLDAEDLVRMIFGGVLADGIEVSAAYIAPGHTITTWAMNTRTAAVTEYQNFEFNSFARLGNKYLGASADGLYELLGDDDDGDSVIATIRSGFAQWAGAHLHSFKGAYLAVRGEGAFVLKLITGDDRSFHYTVTAESMKTVKVNMGKGLRARYFAFELISSGQDFDLETLEFIPLVAVRRV